MKLTNTEEIFNDISTTEKFPKTLVIRNHEGGMIWQVYHVEKLSEGEKISYNATMNGFESITLEDYQPEMEQTWPDWRKTCNSDILK
jgi:hypothetical protein